MPQPTISFCILCESVRPEPQGKGNILGFYGVLPAAHILVGEIGKAVPALMFLAGLSGPGDESFLRARIVNPDGSTLIEMDKSAGIKVPPIAAQQSSLGGIGFAGLTFTQEGIYTVHLILDDQEAYQNSFTLRQGPITLSK